MNNIFKSIAISVLYVLIFPVSLFSENSAQMWFPAKNELSAISWRSIVAINIVVLIIVLLFIGLIIRAVVGK
jgi:hypothetical protein